MGKYSSISNRTLAGIVFSCLNRCVCVFHFGQMWAWRDLLKWKPQKCLESRPALADVHASVSGRMMLTAPRLCMMQSGNITGVWIEAWGSPGVERASCPGNEGQEVWTGPVISWRGCMDLITRWSRTESALLSNYIIKVYLRYWETFKEIGP